MEQIIAYFSTIPSSHRSLILFGGIGFFWLIEYAIPLFKTGYAKVKHGGINIFFTLTTIVVNFLLAMLLLVKTTEWTAENHFGILNWLPEMNIWLYAMLGLLLMDFIGAYFIHWLEHKVKWMWQFHLVHHTDVNVDVTTANRHHPGESLFRFVFTMAAVFVTGAPLWLFMLYQSLSVVVSQFGHANIQIPKGLDRVLSWIIVTPNMHHVHHHYVLPYSDTNYGNIFAIWDRIFGTFGSLSSDQLQYGLDTHLAEKEHSNIGTILKAPFVAYRPPSTGSKFSEQAEK